MSTILDLLNKIPAEKEKRQKMQIGLKEQFAAYGKELIIYGHGNLGTELRKGLENAGWRVRYFIDANQSTDLCRENINLTDAKQYIASDAIIIVAIYNIFAEYPVIHDKLRSMGFQNVFSVLDLRIWPELFQAGHIHSTLSWDIEHIPAEQICKAYSLMEDAISKKIYRELVGFFISDDKPELTLCPGENQYMPDTVYLPSESERIIDCGAYNGDTMRAFFSRIQNWRSYTAIEPDKHNFEDLCASIQKTLPPLLVERTRAIHAAVSDEMGEAVFCENGTTASHIMERSAEGEYTVPIIRMDDVINDPVTFIKMDVEGFELRALQGAEGLIRRDQPLLAICGYHKQSDLWEIPLYMKNILPDHHILLRNYVGIIEYVFYAVPKNRVLPDKQP
jgi:FkbM family methyltransferase